ncbi:MAG: hypothetical protein ACHQ2Z_02525 [Elusimicrobiota bacterium]
MRGRRRGPARAADARGAALTVAALAVAVLTPLPPDTVPKLKPGFGRVAAAPPRVLQTFSEPELPSFASARTPPEEPAASRVPRATQARPRPKETFETGIPNSSSGTESLPVDRPLNEWGSTPTAPATAWFGPGRTNPSRPPVSPNANNPAHPAADPSRSGTRAKSAVTMTPLPSTSRVSEPIPARTPARTDAAARGVSFVGASPDSRAARPRDGGSQGTPRADGRGSARLSADSHAQGRSANDAFPKERPRHPRERAPERPPKGRKAAERAPHRVRPLLLSKLIGLRPLQPPPSEIQPPPTPSDWKTRRPANDSKGRPIPDARASLDALDAEDPGALSRDRRKDAHWDGDEWHDGDVHGLVHDGAWLRLQSEGGRWWAFAGDGGAQLYHDKVWWVKESGIWFVVHDGQPWAWRSFQDWDAQGLVQPATGTEMVYSKDFTRVEVITPGEGADFFDAATGAELGEIPEERLNPVRRPRMVPELDPAKVFKD